MFNKYHWYCFYHLPSPQRSDRNTVKIISEIKTNTKKSNFDTDSFLWRFGRCFRPPTDFIDFCILLLNEFRDCKWKNVAWTHFLHFSILQFMVFEYSTVSIILKLIKFRLDIVLSIFVLCDINRSRGEYDLENDIFLL